MDRQQQIERLRQRVLDIIHNYRDVGRPFETHSSLPPQSWVILSYPVPPMIWFQYYRELENFVLSVDTTNGWRGMNNRLYIHGTVFLPFNAVIKDVLLMTVYRLFYFNTPYAVWHFIRAIRFRLLFVASTSSGNHITIERLRLTSEPSNTRYPGTSMICES